MEGYQDELCSFPFNPSLVCRNPWQPLVGTLVLPWCQTFSGHHVYIVLTPGICSVVEGTQPLLCRTFY